MNERLTKTKRRRFLAFIFDMFFIMFLAFSINGLLGIFFKLDSEVYQNVMLYVLLAIVLPYIFFGEIIFKNTFGKYLFGLEVVNKDDYQRPKIINFLKRGLIKVIWPLEGLVLLFSKNKKRLGDLWAKTIVVKKESNKYNPSIRLLIGLSSCVVLYFSFSIFMGLGVKNSDFYNEGSQYLKTNNIEIVGLPKEVNQVGEVVNYVVPISDSLDNRYALICLEKVKGNWTVYHVEKLNKHKGRTFNFNLSSAIHREYFENGKLSFEGTRIDSKKEGTCKWFHENGELKESTIWHNNLLQGKLIRYHSNGKVEAEAVFVNGVKEGKAILRHDNGQISELLFYKNDLIIGDYISYHPNGQVFEKGQFENSERVGKWEKYDKEGYEIEEVE